MPDRRVDFLLIGGGVAAGSCAKTLREEGADGSILLVGREPDPPYTRPPLSKEYLAGKAGRDDAFFLAPDWAEQNDVELLTRTSVMKLDPGARVAKLSNKQEVEFGKALLATGANVRRLRVDGSDLDGIHYLRAFGNADAIRSDAEEAERVVCIGGSYISCEVAATLTSLGKRVTMLMQEEVCLERQWGKDVARLMHDGLEQHGVEIHGDDELERFEGEGRLQKVVSKRGRELDADLVVIGAGVAPDGMLARSAGLDLGERGGVACDARLQTSGDGIFAAGDAAEFDSPLHGRRVAIEHWDVAVEHGKTAARNMLGRDREHDVVPYFWSDFADWLNLEYVGVGPGEPVVRGSLAERDFTAFYVDDGRVVGALTSGRSDDLDHARRMITARTTPERDALADEGTDLGGL